MELNVLRDMAPEELVQKERELRRELFNLRFQSVSGRVDNPTRLRQTRRDIAQVKTVLVEKNADKEGKREGK